MSKIDDIQRDRKRTIATTYRGDIRTIATLLTFWRQKGESPSSLVSLVRLSIEAFKEMIVDKHPEYEFTSTASATELLDRVGLLDLSKSRPNLHNLIKELSMESIVDKGLDPVKTAVSKGDTRREALGPYASEQERDSLAKELERSLEPDVLIVREEELKEEKDGLGEKPKEGGVE